MPKIIENVVTNITGTGKRFKKKKQQFKSQRVKIKAKTKSLEEKIIN